MNVIARLEFELAYYLIVGQHVRHTAAETPRKKERKKEMKKNEIKEKERKKIRKRKIKKDKRKSNE